MKGSGSGHITIALWRPFERSFGRVGNAHCHYAWHSMAGPDWRLSALRVMGYDSREH